MKTNTQDDTITLSSLPATAALITAGCELKDVSPIPGGRFEFTVLGKDAELLAADYMLGRLVGDLQEYHRNFELLRTAIRRAGEARR